MSVTGLQDQLVKANRSYRAHFLEAAIAGQAKFGPVIDTLCQMEPSTGPGNEYNFGDATPVMVEMEDERPLVPLGVKGWSLDNVTYVNGVSIKVEDFMDDRLGIHRAQISNLATGYWWKLIGLLRGLINGGFAALHYDGVAFFSASHPNNTFTNDNLATGGLSEANLKLAVTKLRDMRATNGEYLQLAPTHLVYGNDNEWVARDILMQSIQATGEQNMMMGLGLRGIQIPGLATGRWAVMDLSWATKPFIKQDREALSFTEVTAPDSHDVFSRRLFKYGATYRGALGYGHYQFAVGSTG